MDSIRRFWGGAKEVQSPPEPRTQGVVERESSQYKRFELQYVLQNIETVDNYVEVKKNNSLKVFELIFIDIQGLCGKGICS